MARFLKSRAKRKGALPGSLILSEDPQHKDFKVTVLNYNKDIVEEKVINDFKEALPQAQDPNTVTWIDVEGLNDTQSIEQIGKQFGIHLLWLEDVLNVDHRPKVDELNDLLFVIMKSVLDDSTTKKIVFEQVSLFMGPSFVLSFQERPGDLFLAVKERIRNSKGRIRQVQKDYLFYALMDAVIDNYFATLERIGKEIEDLESAISIHIDKFQPRDIMSYKSELLYLNKAATPIRDALAHICRAESPDIEKETRIYFQDAYEHAVQVVDTISQYRQLLNSLMDYYRSSVNQRMNEVMKVLTMFASVFIPLTFIVGVYGMNFEYMPELKWRYGYHATWVFMLLLTLSMGIYFKRKKWF